MTRISQSGKTTQGVANVLQDPESSLGSLLERANFLLHLESLLSALLDPDLAAQFQVAATRKNRLILISPSASWATRLRIQAPRLISALHEAGARQIEHIDIRVAPLVQPSMGARLKKRLSPAAKKALDHMAQFKSKTEE